MSKLIVTAIRALANDDEELVNGHLTTTEALCRYYTSNHGDENLPTEARSMLNGV